jgi:hypothetical protein
MIRLDQSVEKVGYAVGLDGRPRIGPGRYGIKASARARWETGRNLVIALDELGSINRWELASLSGVIPWEWR